MSIFFLVIYPILYTLQVRAAPAITYPSRSSRERRCTSGMCDAWQLDRTGTASESDTDGAIRVSVSLPDQTTVDTVDSHPSDIVNSVSPHQTSDPVIPQPMPIGPIAPTLPGVGSFDLPVSSASPDLSNQHEPQHGSWGSATSTKILPIPLVIFLALVSAIFVFLSLLTGVRWAILKTESDTTDHCPRRLVKRRKHLKIKKLNFETSSISSSIEQEKKQNLFVGKFGVCDMVFKPMNVLRLDQIFAWSGWPASRILGRSKLVVGIPVPEIWVTPPQEEETRGPLAPSDIIAQIMNRTKYLHPNSAYLLSFQINRAGTQRVGKQDLEVQ